MSGERDPVLGAGGGGGAARPQQVVCAAIWLLALAAGFFFAPSYFESDFLASSVNVRYQYPLVLFFLLQSGRFGFCSLQPIIICKGNHKTFFHLVLEEENLMVFKELDYIELLEYRGFKANDHPGRQRGEHCSV